MRDSGGSLLLPLAIEPGSVRRLTWFASDLCDYNAPLLAADFSRRVGTEQFREYGARSPAVCKAILNCVTT